MQTLFGTWVLNEAACQLLDINIVSETQIKATICRSFRKIKEGIFVRKRTGGRIIRHGAISAVKDKEKGESPHKTEIVIPAGSIRFLSRTDVV